MANPWDADYKDPKTGEAVYEKPKKPAKKKPKKKKPSGPGSLAEDVVGELDRRNKSIVDKYGEPKAEKAKPGDGKMPKSKKAPPPESLEKQKRKGYGMKKAGGGR